MGPPAVRRRERRLSIQRHGRTVSFDRFGVSIDGHRIVSDDLRRAHGDRGFAVRPDGAVLYQQRVVASIAPPVGQYPGEVTSIARTRQPQPIPGLPAGLVAPPQPQQEMGRYEEQEMDL